MTWVSNGSPHFITCAQLIPQIHPWFNTRWPLDGWQSSWSTYFFKQCWCMDLWQCVVDRRSNHLSHSSSARELSFSLLIYLYLFYMIFPLPFESAAVLKSTWAIGGKEGSGWVQGLWWGNKETKPCNIYHQSCSIILHWPTLSPYQFRNFAICSLFLGSCCAIFVNKWLQQQEHLDSSTSKEKCVIIIFHI